MRQPTDTIERPSRRGTVRAVEGASEPTARHDALRWLALQLGWERTLDHLRYSDEEQSAAAA